MGRAILTKNKKIQIFGNLLKLARKVVTYVEASTGSVNSILFSFQLFSLSVVPGQFLGHRRGAKFDVDLY